MHSVRSILLERLRTALSACSLPREAAEVSTSADPRFGDYQSNTAMALARQTKSNPRQLATSLLSHLDVADLSAAPELAGAGFINFRISDAFLNQTLTNLLQDPRCGVDLVEKPETIVIDFSSPNVAKPMHVVHFGKKFDMLCCFALAF